VDEPRVKSVRLYCTEIRVLGRNERRLFTIQKVHATGRASGSSTVVTARFSRPGWRAGLWISRNCHRPTPKDPDMSQTIHRLMIQVSDLDAA
jgi:hypothetical protein